MQTKRFLILLAALLPFAAFAAPRVHDSALGTVRYEVRYKWGAVNTKVADATITLENVNWEGQAACHSHVVIRASSIFRLFMSADYLVDVYLSRSGTEPLYFVNPVKKNGKDGKYEYFYDKAARTIRSVATLPPNEPETASFPLDGRTMDLVSLLQFVRFHDLPEDGSMKLKVLMSGKSYAATLSCEGPDDERFPNVPAIRLKVRMTERGLMENGSGNEITLWRSAGTDRRILGLETALGDSSSMSVSIKE